MEPGQHTSLLAQGLSQIRARAGQGEALGQDLGGVKGQPKMWPSQDQGSISLGIRPGWVPHEC